MEWGGVFNVARYLTDSLRGPVLQTLRRARSASFHCGDQPASFSFVMEYFWQTLEANIKVPEF